MGRYDSKLSKQVGMMVQNQEKDILKESMHIWISTFSWREEEN